LFQKIDITVTPEGLELVRGKDRFFYPVCDIRQVFYRDYIITPQDQKLVL